MTPKSLVRLAWADGRTSLGRSLLACLGVALLAMLVALVLALGTGLRHAVLRQVSLALPIDTVEVQPRSFDVGLLKLGGESLLGHSGLNSRNIDVLRALPQVQRISEKVSVDMPMGAQGGQSLFGRPLYVDLFVTGLAEALVDDAEKIGFTDRQDFVPVVLSPQLIDIYNAQVAPALGTPALSSEVLGGFCFELRIGRSLMLGTHGAAHRGSERACVVGTSVHAARLGISVPLAVARRLMQRYGQHGEAQPSSVIVKLRHAADLDILNATLADLGLQMDDAGRKAQQILALLFGVGAGLCLLLLLLCGLSMAQSFASLVQARQKDVAILRSVGASRGDIWQWVALQAATIGLLGAATGLLSARLAAWATEAALRRALPASPFLPRHVFDFATAHAAVIVLGACLTAISSATPAAWRAARASVAESLR